MGELIRSGDVTFRVSVNHATQSHSFLPVFRRDVDIVSAAVASESPFDVLSLLKLPIARELHHPEIVLYGFSHTGDVKTPHVYHLRERHGDVHAYEENDKSLRHLGIVEPPVYASLLAPFTCVVTDVSAYMPEEVSSPTLTHSADVSRQDIRIDVLEGAEIRGVRR